MNELKENTITLAQLFWTQNKNWIISTSHKASLLLTVAAVVAIVIRWPELPAQVPLWYGKPWGTERLAHPLWLFILPAGSLMWHVINTIAALFVTRDYLVFTQLLFITSFLVSLLSFVTLIKILFIIT